MGGLAAESEKIIHILLNPAKIRLILIFMKVRDKGGYRISLRVLQDFEKGKNFQKREKKVTRKSKKNSANMV